MNISSPSLSLTQFVAYGSYVGEMQFISVMGISLDLCMVKVIASLKDFVVMVFWLGLGLGEWVGFLRDGFWGRGEVDVWMGGYYSLNPI